MANSRLVRANGGFEDKLCAYSEKRRTNLMFYAADFSYLTQELKSNGVHLSNKYAGIVMLSARPMNHARN